jgi:hypothetical protein
VKEFLDDPVVEGWVNRFYLAEQMTPELFCDDPNALAVIDDLVAAVETHDGDLLAELVLPARGVRVVPDADTGLSVDLSVAELRTFFTSEHIYDWGINAYSGEPINGTIGGVILPRLEEAILAESSTQACYDQQEDKLRANLPIYASQGGMLGPYNPIFPDGQQNFYSILKPGTPGNEFDYIGWAIGIEYWDGQPYINALISYAWIA